MSEMTGNRGHLPALPLAPSCILARAPSTSAQTFVIIGWAVAMACIFGVYIAHGGNIAVILHAPPFEMTTIFGAALGAFPAQQIR